MHYKEHQIAKMVVNPYVKDSLLKMYPKLKEVKKESDTLLTDKDLDMYFRYVSFVYDPHSPMNHEYPTLDQRKAMAKEEVGYNGQDYPELAAYFIIIIINNRLWTEIASNENVFDEFTIKVNKPIGVDLDEDKQLKAVQLKNVMLTQMSEMRKRITTLRNELFSGDIEIVNTEKKITIFNAENVAFFEGNE